MIHILLQKASQDQINSAASDLQGYIKIIVDIEREIVAVGGERHVEAEHALLADGSKQSALWGGGFDTETREIDYNSMINLRPHDNNPSREILSEEVRKKFDAIVKKILW